MVCKGVTLGIHSIVLKTFLRVCKERMSTLWHVFVREQKTVVETLARVIKALRDHLPQEGKGRTEVSIAAAALHDVADDFDHQRRAWKHWSWYGRKDLGNVSRQVVGGYPRSLWRQGPIRVL
jgi:hypothetical protein